MKSYQIYGIISVLILGASFASSFIQTSTPLNYLALGDSYTIGASVPYEENWPNQLKHKIEYAGQKVDLKIIAKTGWTCQNLLNQVTSSKETTQYDIVSLQIGVNNEYQGERVQDFNRKFEACLNAAIVKSKYGKDGVFVLSIPNYGYTPFGENNKQAITRRINAFNNVSQSICKKNNILYIDITTISEEATELNNFISDDGLHPSKNQYTNWIEKIYPIITHTGLLKNPTGNN